jgi:hypothetical protein
VRQPLDSARPHPLPQVVWRTDEIKKVPGGWIHEGGAIDFAPSVVVLSDRAQDLGATRRRGKIVVGPVLHDPAGERGVIRLRDEQLP